MNSMSSCCAHPLLHCRAACCSDPAAGARGVCPPSLNWMVPCPLPAPANPTLAGGGGVGTVARGRARGGGAAGPRRRAALRVALPLPRLCALLRGSSAGRGAPRGARRHHRRGGAGGVSGHGWLEPRGAVGLRPGGCGRPRAAQPDAGADIPPPPSKQPRAHALLPSRRCSPHPPHPAPATESRRPFETPPAWRRCTTLQTCTASRPRSAPSRTRRTCAPRCAAGACWALHGGGRAVGRPASPALLLSRRPCCSPPPLLTKAHPTPPPARWRCSARSPTRARSHAPVQPASNSCPSLALALLAPGGRARRRAPPGHAARPPPTGCSTNRRP